MLTKLTLTIEQNVIKGAKVYAQKKGRSLSNIVENYLKTLAARENSTQVVSPRVKRLVGAVKLPDDFDYKRSLEQALAEKHGK